MKEVIIKKDGDFNLKYIPKKNGSITYNGVGYLDSDTGEPFEGTIDIFKTQYDRNKNRLEKPTFVKSRNIILQEKDNNG